MTVLPRLACLLLLATPLAATAANVYQWKDADGVIHSSDKPPQGQKYEERRIDQRDGAAADTQAIGKPVEDPQCTTARANLELLQGNTAVQIDSDGDGKLGRTLDEGERSSQKALAEAAVKAYCKPAATEK